MILHDCRFKKYFNLHWRIIERCSCEYINFISAIFNTINSKSTLSPAHWSNGNIGNSFQAAINDETTLVSSRGGAYLEDIHLQDIVHDSDGILMFLVVFA